MVDDTDVGYYPAASGTPANDTAAYGGAINTAGGVLNPATINLLIGALSIDPSVDKTVYGAAYRKNIHATDTATALVASNRCGAITNLATGTPFAQSTSALDVGQMLLVAKVGGTWNEIEWDATGTSAAAASSIADIGTATRWQYFVAGSPAVPYGNITGMIGAQICTVLYGSLGGNGRSMTSTEYAIALCTAINTALGTFTNRLTAPTGVSSFASGAKWTGLDETIAVPGGGSLTATQYIGYVIRLILKAGIPRPRGMGLRSAFGIIGAA